jgi:hypothetical protein
MRFLMALLLTIACCATAAEIVSKYEQPRFRTATIYADNTNRKVVLFKLTRTFSEQGKVVKVAREFTSPQGKVAARERVTYNGDQLVSCEVDDLQADGRGSAKVVREGGEATIVFEYISGTKRKTGVEPFTADTVNNDMVNPCLVAHWNELMSGKAIKCRYIALSRAETVGIQFSKVGETTARGMPVIIIKMVPSNFFVAAVVNPLFFTVEKNGQHRVLDYDGRTTPKIQVGDKLKDLDALTVFDW